RDLALARGVHGGEAALLGAIVDGAGRTVHGNSL
ncbi:MAG: hypothetical protein RIQ41_572, partial [Candidatus Parcubacteria bacterium]